jgi:A/G-specific adenine glycosylase
VGDLAGRLIGWWEGHGRHELPWRATRDPWAVLVSELMLQQTQVPRVVPRWSAFVERFPTAAACAAAPVGEVVGAWAGLGYNRRAVNLHRCATAVVERHGGLLPATLPELLALPGVGPYTARAVLVFAFGRDVGLVDTNAGRFVARALAGRAVGRSEAQAVADAAVPPGDGWRWGSAVFDLGALVCTKRSPRCDACPLRDRGCAWAAAGWPDPDPVVGSAGISTPQSRFDGSDRQGRGRLVDALRAGPVPSSELASVMGWPDDPARAARVAAGVVADGLAVVDPSTGTWTLPTTAPGDG